MPIRVQCECGKALAVAETAQGKRVKCGVCGRAVEVPFEVNESWEQAAPPAPQPQGGGAVAVHPRHHRHHVRHGSSSSMAIHLTAAMVFLVLIGVVLYLFVGNVRPQFLSEPGRVFLRRWQGEVINYNDDAVRNLMTDGFASTIKVAEAERYKDETDVGAWLRLNRKQLLDWCSGRYVREDPVGGRIKVSVIAQSGSPLSFYIARQGDQWRFDGYE
jgi:hypothetical protein